MKDANMDKTIAMSKDGVALEVVGILFGALEVELGTTIVVVLGEILCVEFVIFP